MIRKAPFQLPPGFLAAFGYPGQRRFVALYWEPSGDEAAYDDGVNSAIGMADNWLYLDFVRQAEVRRWLDENGINLGNSDEPARYWLVVDAQTNDVYAAPTGEACRILRTQSVPVVE
jgi:hypothetical protein